MYHTALSEQVDENDRVPLIRHFTTLGIPNFLAAQGICLIESSLMHQKEKQLEKFIPDNNVKSPKAD